MDFELSELQRAWRDKGARLAEELAPEPAAADVVLGAARLGLLAPDADLLALTLAVEAMAIRSASAAIALALHSAAALSVAGRDGYGALFDGQAVGALTLSSDAVPQWRDGTLTGRVSWVAPLTGNGVAMIAGRADGGAEDAVAGVADGGLMAYALRLDAPGVTAEPLDTAALAGVACGHLTLAGAPCEPIGPTLPVMSRARILISAVGLGIARRAVREALASARGTSRGAGGEQTVQGLVADAATDLDAAMLLTWTAAASPLSLSSASMAKLAATVAAQRAVERATQVIGADSFRRGHILERLAKDVRALELFAGRTDALRDAVAERELPSA